jgi:hypothetical protein
VSVTQPNDTDTPFGPNSSPVALLGEINAMASPEIVMQVGGLLCSERRGHKHG